MKKLAFIIVFCLGLLSVSYGQPTSTMLNEKFEGYSLPFNRIIEMTPKELLDVGFKFNKRKNRYTLKKHSQQTNSDRALIGGNERTHADYEVYIYMGKRDKAIIQICFYNPFAYSAIEEWIYKWYSSPYRLTGPNAEMYEFIFDKYKVRLMQNSVFKRQFYFDSNRGVISSTFYDAAAITVNIKENVGLKKDYYPIYIYTVFTGEEPHSKWLKNQQNRLKSPKREGGSLEDLM